MSTPDANGDCPVVFWDHDEQSILDVAHYKWPTFLSWLRAGLERSRLEQIR
jgi:hypothetical protein